jgi:type VI secretion system protein VasJ
MTSNEEHPMNEQENATVSETTGEKQPSTSDGNEDTHESSIVIPVDVMNLLNDISVTAPAGENPETAADQDTVVLYMTLETEMSKLSNNDYALCVSSARELLLKKSKHIRVAVWLLIAWFRTESVEGFRKGLLVILELLKKYGDALIPEKPAQRSKIIQSIAAEGRLKLIQKIEVNSGNADRFEEIGKIFQMLVDECNKQFEEKPPRLTSFAKIIEGKTAEAQKLKEKGLKSEQKREIPDRPALRSEAAQQAPSRESVPVPAVRQPGATPPGTLQAITHEKDAVLAMKRALLFYFEGAEDGSDGRKIPDDPSIFGMSRLLRWGKITALPPHKENVTQLEPPNQPKQAFIEKLVRSRDFDTMIPEIEIQFLNKDEFLFWLDAQRYVVQALEERGGGAALEAAEEVKIQLARLLGRHSDLPTLLFRDKKTPFANPDTLNWIDQEIRTLIGGGTKQDTILPPIFGEEYEDINKTYESMCGELPANFEKNARAIQNAVEGDIRPKGRFLRMLSLANFCYAAKKYDIASILFNDLLEKIRDYSIAEWEQALCVAVWQSAYLNNLKMMKTDMPNQRIEMIEEQQGELYDLIGRYDCIRALKLTNQKQK